MINWQVHLDKIYSVAGVDAVLTTVDGEDKDLRVIPKLQKVTVGSGVNVSTVDAAAVVRVSEFAAQGLERDTIEGARLAFGGVDRKVEQAAPAPGPNGEDDGELYLILSETS